MNIYISTHLWQFNLYFDHIYGKTISFLLTWSTLDEGTHGMVRPGFFHIAASLLIHPRWGYVALGSNVGDRCECPKIGSTPGGFDRFDLHIGILTIDLNMKPLYDIFKHETLIWYIYIIYITLDLNMKHGKNHPFDRRSFWCWAIFEGISSLHLIFLLWFNDCPPPT